MSSVTENCIFCKICKKEAPADIVYEDEDVVIFKDIKPSATFHYLAIPRQHINTAKDLKLDQKHILENLIAKGSIALQQNGGDLTDVRMGFHWPPFNSISHLHLHVISPVAEMGFIARQIFKPNSWWFVTADDVLQRLSNKL